MDILKIARATIDAEAASLNKLSSSIGESFVQAVNSINNCKGKLLLVGIGKSGHIARKAASTFSSTGTPSSYLHPSEASHGDLGMIHKDDVVMAISKSGESIELKDIISYCKLSDIHLISITSADTSSLANISNITLRLPIVEEACPLGLAPTSSTTMALALTDALAVCALSLKDFSKEKFLRYHPGGKLGQYFLKVKDVMKKELPLVTLFSPLSESIVQMSKGRMGCVGIVDEFNKLKGIFTDGDLRMKISSYSLDTPICKIMSHDPKRIDPESSIEEVIYLFKKERIPSVFSCIDDVPIGIIHFHDLLQRNLL